MYDYQRKEGKPGIKPSTHTQWGEDLVSNELVVEIIKSESCKDLPVVIVLLSIGFIIAVILSWIYDIHPEGGMVKTEHIEKVKTEEFHKTSSSWKIATYISFVVIVGLIILNIFSGNGRRGSRENLPLSIAILPFHDESPDGANQYIVNNLMNSIVESLSKIEGLTIIGRSSTEQYRDINKSTLEKGEELGVSYLIEGYGTLISKNRGTGADFCQGVSWARQGLLGKEFLG